MPTVLGLTTDTKPKMAPDTYVSKNKPLANGERLNTISKRNHAAALEIETLLWRALCDKPEKAKEYMADDVVMINPLFSGSNDPVSKYTEPSIEEVLEGNEPWMGFKFHGDPLVVEVDLMAVSLVYKISLFRRYGRKGNKVREVLATCSSSWRQTAGADWLLCAMHVAYADEEAEEEEGSDEE
ncbi:hypothetical protein V8F20_004923 [Naviculisporaceae sp. PSN 640]